MRIIFILLIILLMFSCSGGSVEVIVQNGIVSHATFDKYGTAKITLTDGTILKVINCNFIPNRIMAVRHIDLFLFEYITVHPTNYRLSEKK